MFDDYLKGFKSLGYEFLSTLNTMFLARWVEGRLGARRQFAKAGPWKEERLCPL
jgi:hypothetical protein